MSITDESSAREIHVVKRDGSRAPYDGYEIARSIEEASRGLDDSVTRATQIASELEITLFDGITSQQLDEAVIGVALGNVKDDPAFDRIAARLLIKTLYKAVLGDGVTRADLAARHRDRFPGFLADGVRSGLLDARLTELFDLLLGRHVGGVVLDGLGADVDQVRALGDQQPAEAQGVLGADGDRLAVPAVLAEVEDAHDRGVRVGVDLDVAEPKRGDGGVEQVAVLLHESGEALEVDHFSSAFASAFFV